MAQCFFVMSAKALQHVLAVQCLKHTQGAVECASDAARAVNAFHVCEALP